MMGKAQAAKNENAIKSKVCVLSQSIKYNLDVLDSLGDYRR